MNEILTGLRWQVREAAGGAEAWAAADLATPEAVIVDSWLPDLDQGEFMKEFRSLFPDVDLVTADGISPHEGPRGPHRQELLYALRRSQDVEALTETAEWNPIPRLVDNDRGRTPVALNLPSGLTEAIAKPTGGLLPGTPKLVTRKVAEMGTLASERLPELIGEAPCMLEVSRRVRLVASRSTPVLIEGPTGSGKELVALALHRLSNRSRKPFVALNCAAIPEALLEAELFGHTRGAFTGAVQGRVGRIEAAEGGTLFLDEIGEMPLSLQAKLLRFVESGELQRVGDNETVKVDVRIVAATHRHLAQHAQTNSFRPDLYYRLAVFLIRTPALADHKEDLPLLVDHFLERMGRETPIKQMDEAAMARLTAHSWLGNVRELEHVLERAAILAGDAPVLTSREIDFGIVVN
ncbi:MAG TPA: sigma-54 dependent transcriptional regulator [Terracidiphilus sp.]|nr:sigma-54 dependent transcriptional regulator [Terracidiphilus sp.]